MSLHFLIGKIKAGGISPSVEAGISTGDHVPVLGIDFVAAINYSFKLSTYTLKKSDIVWFDTVGKKLENRFNQLLGLNKIPKNILDKLLETLSKVLKDVQVAIKVQKITNEEASKKLEDILDETLKAQEGTFYQSGKELTEKEKNDATIILKWVDKKKEAIQEAFKTFTQKYAHTPSNQEPDKNLLFLKQHQTGIIQLVDGYYFKLQEAVKPKPKPLKEGASDTCYLEIKRYDHVVIPGVVYSLTLANPSGSGVTGEVTHAIAMAASITKSIYQTYVRQTHGSTKRKLILTQSNRVGYKKIEIPSTVEGVIKVKDFEAGVIKSKIKPVLNIMDYHSVSIYWRPLRSEKQSYTISPLPGSGISFGTSVMLDDLENAAKELKAHSSSKYYEKKIKGYADSLNVDVESIKAFLKQLGKEMTKEVTAKMKGHQMVLLESAYRFAGKELKIKVKDFKKNRLEQIRDVNELKKVLALNNNYRFNMEDIAGLQLESIRIRVRNADSQSNQASVFRLGYYLDGTGGSVMFTGKTEAGNQSIINFSPFFFNDVYGRRLNNDERIDQAVPPVFLVPHSL